MGNRIGLKAHLKNFEANGKLNVTTVIYGEEAQALLDFMEVEGLDSPGAAARMLIASAVSAYPEWAVTVSARRTVVMEQRQWASSRLAIFLRELAEETEQGFLEARKEMEADLMETAAKRFMGNE